MMDLCMRKFTSTKNSQIIKNSLLHCGHKHTRNTFFLISFGLLEIIGLPPKKKMFFNYLKLFVLKCSFVIKCEYMIVLIIVIVNFDRNCIDKLINGYILSILEVHYYKI